MVNGGLPITPPSFYYRGRHCLLRALSDEDIRSLYPHAQVLAVLADYRPWYKPQVHPLEWMVQRRDWLASVDPPMELEALVLDAVHGSPLGFVCLGAIDTANGKAELALGMFRGRGTRATLETLHWVMETAFSVMGLHKLVFCVSEDNTPAHRLLGHLGIPLEAVLRSEMRTSAGDRADLMRYALLAPEWQQGPLRPRFQHWVPLHPPSGAPLPI